MKTIKVMLDPQLLRAADRAVHRRKLNRSALIRRALQEYLRKLEVRELEDRDRKGYERMPQRAEEVSGWEPEVSWPAD